MRTPRGKRLIPETRAEDAYAGAVRVAVGARAGVGARAYSSIPHIPIYTLIGGSLDVAVLRISEVLQYLQHPTVHLKWGVHVIS